MIQDGSIGLGVKFEEVLATSMSARDIKCILSKPGAGHTQATARSGKVFL